MRAFFFQPSGFRLRPVPSSAAIAAALVLISSLLGPARAAAQWPGRVEGTVVDALSLRPVPDASVSVVSTAPAGAPSATTDASGRFTVKGLGDGAHVLAVRRPGYATARAEVEVGEGRVTRMRVALEPAPLVHAGVDVRVRGAAPGAFRVEPEAGASGSAGDLLRAAPGVVVDRRGAGGAETVSVRGSRAHEVLVLVDGVPLNDPLTGVADLSLVPASSVASLAVLPGARSAEYGARAQGGVILIESRAPETGLRARAGVGSLGELGAEVGFGGMRDGGVGWAVTGLHEEVDGAFDFRLPGSAGGGEGIRTNADRTRTTLSASLEAPVGTGSLDVRLRAGETRRGLPGRSYAPSPHARQRDRRLQLSAGWDTRRDDLRLSAEGFGALRRSRVLDPAPPTGLPWDDRTRAWIAGTRLRAEGDHRGLRLGGGLDVQVQAVRSDGLTESADGSRADAGVFATVEGGREFGSARVTGRLTGRVDRSGEDRGTVPSHEASLHASLAGSTRASVSLHAAWRSAFAPPTLADQHFRSGVGVEANPHLRGERVPHELEAGASFAGHLRGVLLSGSVTAHRGDVRDMIEWVPDFRFVWSPRNVDVERRGVDVRGEARLPVAGGAATVAGSWSRTRVTYDRPDAADVQLRYRPLNTAVVSGSWAGPALDVELVARYTGLRHPVPARVNALPGFWATDLAVRARIPLGDRWTLVPDLRVERLFDGTDTLVFGFPHPGRTLSVGVGLTGAKAGS